MTLTKELSEKAMRIWEEHMSSFCTGRNSAFNLSTELIFDLLQNSTTLRILDIASGYGGWSKFIQDAFENKNIETEFIGMDDSAHRLEIYQEILGKNSKIIQGDILTTLPAFEENNGKVDVAILGWAAHEIELTKLEQVYIMINKLLKPNGILLIADFVSELNPDMKDLVMKLIKNRREKLLSDPDKKEEEQWIKEINQHEKHNYHNNHEKHHHHHPEHYAVTQHINLLNKAGFSSTDEVWRHMNSSMILAIK